MIDLKKNIIFEDNHLLVINKECGYAVQNETNSNCYTEFARHYIKQTKNKPGNVWLGMVHRLDQAVSGVLIFAKTSKSAQRISQEIQSRQAQKTYIAISENQMNSQCGTLEHFIVKKSFKSSIVSKEYQNAKKAVLDYEVIDSSKKLSLLKINLKTGYYHQIRTQLSHIGHPIIGDTKYGSSIKTPRGQIFLHSYQMAIMHPTLKKKLIFKALFPVFWEQYKKTLTNTKNLLDTF